MQIMTGCMTEKDRMDGIQWIYIIQNKLKKDIKRLPIDVARLVKKAIEGLTENPPKGDIKPLQGSSDGQKRL